MPFSAAILAAEGAGGIAVGAGAARLGGGSRGWRRRRSAAGAAAAAAAPAALSDAEQRADRHRLAGLGDDLGQHAGGRRVDLERHLVGLEFDQRLVGLDGVAALLEPFADGRLGDRTRRASERGFQSPCVLSRREGALLFIGEMEETGAARLDGTHRDRRHGIILVAESRARATIDGIAIAPARPRAPRARAHR